MKLKIAILAGDGIGPEVTREAVNILKAIAEVRRPRLHLHRSPHRRRRHHRRRHAAAAADHRHLPRLRRRSARRSRRQQVQPPHARQTPRGRPAADPPGPRRLRQPSPLSRLRRAHRKLAAAPRGHQRRRHPLRARAARRPLLRPATLLEQGNRRSHQHHALHEGRGHPRLAHRLRARPASAARNSRRSTRPTSSSARSYGAPP